MSGFTLRISVPCPEIVVQPLGTNHWRSCVLSASYQCLLWHFACLPPLPYNAPSGIFECLLPHLLVPLWALWVPPHTPVSASLGTFECLLTHLLVPLWALGAPPHPSVSASLGTFACLRPHLLVSLLALLRASALTCWCLSWH